MSESNQNKRARTSSYGEAVRIKSIDYKDLSDNSSNSSKKLLETIENAFGKDGLGIIAITNVPKVKEMRERLLPLGRKFAMLPDEIKGFLRNYKKLQGDEDMSTAILCGRSDGVTERRNYKDVLILQRVPTTQIRWKMCRLRTKRS